jgi:Protein of unknown function (DUF3574)
MLHWRKYTKIIIAILMVAIISITFQSVYAQSSPETQNPLETEEDSPKKITAYLQEELYFGLSKPGGVVTEEEFQNFMDTEVAPRFPEGATILNGQGQFLDDGKLAKEGSKLLILVYTFTDAKQKQIKEIIDIYKTKFQQESVLRVTHLPVQVKF